MSKQFYQEGGYAATVVAQGFSESKQKGTPFFFLRVRIDAHEDGTPVEKSYERSIDKYITTNTVPYLVEDLKALGYDPFRSFNDLNPDNPQHVSFVGNQIAVYCQHDGEYEKWNLSRPMGTASIEPLAPNKMRQLDTLFGRAAKAASGAAPGPVAAPARAAATTAVADDDDLPL